MTRPLVPRRSRKALRPGIEALDARLLLSTTASPSPLAPHPAQAPVSPHNNSFDGLIGAAAARLAYGVDGTGLAAAVIDTGVDYTHPALGGTFGPGSKVEAGYDLAMNDADPMAETWSHGTMVAGLIASDAPDASGVAPGAEIVPLRVFGNDNKGSFDRIADALQWVVDHHDEYGITVVNISLSDGGNYDSDPFLLSPVGGRISSLIETLRGLKIPVVAATGNSFDGQDQGMGYLAILSGTISVTATTPSDQLVGNAQRLGSAEGGDAATDLAAPGSGLLAPSDHGNFANVEGTSFAAPLVSGAILLLQQLYQSRFGTLPDVSDLEAWLKGGADAITDSVTGITIGRLDIARSAALVPGASSADSSNASVSVADTPPVVPMPSDPPTSSVVVANPSVLPVVSVPADSTSQAPTPAASAPSPSIPAGPLASKGRASVAGPASQPLAAEAPLAAAAAGTPGTSDQGSVLGRRPWTFPGGSPRAMARISPRVVGPSRPLPMPVDRNSTVGGLDRADAARRSSRSPSPWTSAAIRQARFAQRLAWQMRRASLPMATGTLRG